MLEEERKKLIPIFSLSADDKVFTSSSRSRRLSSTASLSLDEQVSLKLQPLVLATCAVMVT